ncbi:MAG: cell division protein FtsL [Xanthomonadales bacterium]|nr:cell division protein FtsL [Xanthomonadales bacterium]NIN59747.1 cell division protein FtsL [Xanthomonadales bacterium]NIN75516.1 cell division protein FtsL [Xanthomonadales bacterium]NIO15205.1 cell division protein FtsL [Xanthomonadales bacterium]NIP12140.1 cell division protein FtsL [Xanthomonadales bacterium]
MGVSSRLLILIIVLLADVGSALGVVYTRHQSRHLAVQLGALDSQRDDAIAEWSRLQLEQAWLADASQIERKARRQLNMDQPEEIRVLVVGQ